MDIRLGSKYASNFCNHSVFFKFTEDPEYFQTAKVSNRNTKKGVKYVQS